MTSRCLASKSALLLRPCESADPSLCFLLCTAKFKCCFGGDPLPTIVWSHNDSRVPEILAAGGATSSQYRVHKLHDIHYLDIGPVSVRDNGQVKCTLMNRYGREEAFAQLIVARKPTMVVLAKVTAVPFRLASAAEAMPSITQPLLDVTIIESRPLKLSCGIVGPQVTVNWFHNGKVPSPGAGRVRSRAYLETLSFS